MDEQEIRAMLKYFGWSYLLRKRRERAYIYAARKVRSKREERYISSFTALAELSTQTVLVKLYYRNPQRRRSKPMPGVVNQTPNNCQEIEADRLNYSLSISEEQQTGD